MKRSSWALVSAALAALAALAWLLFAPQVALPRELLKAVPRDAQGFARVRVARVLSSDAYRRLVLARGGSQGLARVEARCGFNPLAQLDELVAFARPHGPASELEELGYAVVARGPLRHAQLLDCVGKYGRGGSSGLAREEIEGVQTVRSRHGRIRAALLGGDGLIVGDDESVRASLRTLRGRAPSIAADTRLAPLDRELAAASDLSAVAHVPEAWQQRLRDAVGPEAARWPLAAIRAFGTGLTTSAGRLAGNALVLTGDAAQASELARTGQRALAELIGLPAVRLTPLAGPLRQIQLSAHGARVRCAGSIEVSTLEVLLDFVPMLERLGRRGASEPKDVGIAPDAGAPDGSF